MTTTRPQAHIDPAFAGATRPTPRTVAMRTFLPWQVLRFAAINLKMLQIIWRNHHSKPQAQDSGLQAGKA